VKVFRTLCPLLLLAGTTVAQVTVGIVLEQEQFLAGEAIPIGVRITNFSGQTLHLGRDNDWLRINLERKEGNLVSPRADLPVKGEFDLENSSVATKRLDLAQGFVLDKPGNYRVAALVTLADWNREVVSKTNPFDVVGGTTLWEREFGVPTPDGVNRAPEVRRYALQKAIHLKQLKLYARVTDATGERFFGVLPLGILLTFSDPEKQIDRQSNLHVLYQVGARSFSYSVINPDGQFIVRQTYDYTSSRPVLRADKEGTIVVFGGARRLSREDWPAPESAPGSTNEIASPKP
jgi:hypothetical protein